MPKAISVAAVLPGTPRDVAEEHLEELALLADTAGFAVVDQIIQERKKLDPATYIGSGKVQEVKAIAKDAGAETILFDDELSPAHLRNLERQLGITVIDRTGLILAIFAQRARTHEAKTQVELARLQYQLPRLTKMWSHLSRQRGGLFQRGGEGETQLETDRRLIKNKISDLKAELKKIQTQAKTRRRGREQFFKIALVGYTNAGKSTLMNALTQADVLAEDRLFATLDAATRRLEINGETFLITDTVGFIRKLPHQLVASFRSTLEEANEADLLLHVVDTSHPHWLEQMEATEEVLEEIGAVDQPTLLILNKVDRLTDRGELDEMDGISVSALTGEGLDRLKEALIEAKRATQWTETLDIPLADGKAIAHIRAEATILREEYLDDTWRVTITATPDAVGRLRHLLGRPLPMLSPW